MNDIKQVALIVAELKNEYAILKVNYDAIKSNIHFPEIADFLKSYSEFQRQDYLDLIVNSKVVRLFRKLEEFLKEAQRLKKTMLELSELPHSALPAFTATIDVNNRRHSSKATVPEEVREELVPSLNRVFLEDVHGKNQDEIGLIFMKAKIAKKRNDVAKLTKAVGEAEKRVDNVHFIEYCRHFDDRPAFDFMANAKPLLVRRHRSVPVKFTFEKLQRICEKQQRRVEELLRDKGTRIERQLFEYLVLMDLTSQLVARQREERFPELHQRELKMILTKRKISMFYEDNPAIVESLKKEIRAVKRENYQKWLKIKAALNK